MVSEGVDIPRLRVGVYATNVLTEMYFRQVVGRFVRMQEGLPKPQRAWLYLPKDATLVHYAKRIKAERDHVLEEIMPLRAAHVVRYGRHLAERVHPFAWGGPDGYLDRGDEARTSRRRARAVQSRRWRSMTRRTNCETSIVPSSARCRERPVSIIASSMQNSSSEPAAESIRRPSRNWSAVSRCWKSGGIQVLTAAGGGPNPSYFLSERRNSPRTLRKPLESSAIMKWPVSNVTRREPAICA